MAHELTLSIADVNYHVCCHEAAILDEPTPSYQPFLGIASEQPEAVAIEVLLGLGNMPDTRGMAKVFDTGQAWVMLSDGRSRYVKLAPPSLAGRSLWVAQIAHDLTRATVYCGNELIGTTHAGSAVRNPVRYPLDQILLMHILAEHEGALVHGAGVDVDGRGFIFPGRSGAGKSTLCNHLVRREGLKLLSDDRIALRKLRGTFTAYGTPWSGEQGAALNDKVSLCGIVFLRHADTNAIVELKPNQAVERLLPVTSIPWYDQEAMSSILRFCDDLLAHVPAYELCFKPGVDAARLVEGLAESASAD